MPMHPRGWSPSEGSHSLPGAASESVAAVSFGARHGLDLLAKVGAGFALWLRRTDGRREVACLGGTVVAARDVGELIDANLVEAFADVRRLGSPLDLPGRDLEGAPWTVRLLPLPEGAVAAVWLMPGLPASHTATPAAPAPAPAIVNEATPSQLVHPRDLLLMSREAAALAEAPSPARARRLSRALDRQAWRSLGLGADAPPTDPTRAPLGRKLAPLKARVRAMVPDEIGVEWAIPEVLPPVSAPTLGLRFIVDELVRNALAALSGAPRPKLRVRAGVVRLERQARWGRRILAPGAYTFVEVTDSGCGMTDAELDRVRTNPGQGGFGAVCGLAHGWGGAVRVRSSVGRGTIVQVALGLMDRIADADDEPTRPLVALTGPERGHALLVGTIDPAPLAEALARTGLTLAACRTADAALAHFRERLDAGGVNLLVLQVDNDADSRFDIARRLRVLAPVLPVILLTTASPAAVSEELPDLAPGRVVARDGDPGLVAALAKRWVGPA